MIQEALMRYDEFFGFQTKPMMVGGVLAKRTGW
jgi:hypothetical protein